MTQKNFNLQATAYFCIIIVKYTAISITYDQIWLLRHFGILTCLIIY